MFAFLHSMLGSAALSVDQSMRHLGSLSKPAGMGKRYAALWSSGKATASIHHVTRQQRRHEQRKAIRRMMRKGVAA